MVNSLRKVDFSYPAGHYRVVFDSDFQADSTLIHLTIQVTQL